MGNLWLNLNLWNFLDIESDTIRMIWLNIWKKQGNEEVIVVLEIIRNLFGDVSYSEVVIDGLKKWFSSFSYRAISGDPLGSPFE